MISVHRAYAALAAALLTVSLVACSSDEDPSSDREEPTTPVATTSATPAVPEPPGLPAAATQKTAAGAEAFVKYYWDLVAHAQSTGDLGPLRNASAEGCNGCLRGIRGVRAMLDGGAIQVGGSTRVIARVALWDPQGTAELLVDVTTTGVTESYGPNDPRNQVLDRTASAFKVSCIRKGGAWQIAELDPR